MKKLVIESSLIGKVPYMLTCEEGARNLPLVIIAHGFNMDKYEGMDLALRLADRGFASICFDLDRHGQRYDGFLEAISSDVEFGSAIFSVTKNSFHDIEKIIDYFERDLRIDLSRIGLAGISLGANLCYYALAHNPDIRIAVPLLGSPKFVELLCYNMEKESEEEFRTAEERKLLNFVKEIDPYKALLAADPKPLLMINASKDDDIPAEFAASFYKSIKSTYSEKNVPLEHFVADEFHYVSKEMKNMTVDWFEKYL